MTDPDRDLACVEQLKAGNPRALEELYDRHGSLVYSVVLRIVRRAAEADDVVQEVWLQSWKQAASFDPRRGSVVAWLLNRARSRAIDRARSLAARRRAEDALESDPPRRSEIEEPPASVAHRELHRRVTGALASLSEQQRQVLELAYFGGLSQSEIAAKVGAPLGTVKSWARQGLLRLRELVPAEEWA